jgi:hypothetical protein
MALQNTIKIKKHYSQKEVMKFKLSILCEVNDILIQIIWRLI